MCAALVTRLHVAIHLRFQGATTGKRCRFFQRTTCLFLFLKGCSTTSQDKDCISQIPALCPGVIECGSLEYQVFRGEGRGRGRGRSGGIQLL